MFVFLWTHLWLYMPARVGDVVHQKVLRQGRRRHHGHLVVQRHQMPCQLPVHRCVRLVQDLPIIVQKEAGIQGTRSHERNGTERKQENGSDYSAKRHGRCGGLVVLSMGSTIRKNRTNAERTACPRTLFLVVRHVCRQQGQPLSFSPSVRLSRCIRPIEYPVHQNKMPNEHRCPLHDRQCVSLSLSVCLINSAISAPPPTHLDLALALALHSLLTRYMRSNRDRSVGGSLIFSITDSRGLYRLSTGLADARMAVRALRVQITPAFAIDT